MRGKKRQNERVEEEVVEEQPMEEAEEVMSEAEAEGEVDEDGDLVESDDDMVEEEEEQGEQTEQTKKESLYRPPTAAEIRQFEETRSLFQSNIMKLQVRVVMVVLVSWKDAAWLWRNI